METSFINSNRKLQANKPITILTIISLILTVIGSLECFTYYRLGNDDLWELCFSFGRGGLYTIFSLLSCLIFVAPVIVFTIYIFMFYKHCKADILIPVSLGLIVFNPIYYFIRNVILSYGFSSILDVLINVITIASFVLATISALKGFPKKIYIIIAVACGLLSELVSLTSFIGYIVEYLNHGMYLYLLTWPLCIIGNVAFYTALLFFCLNNKISVRIKKETNTEKTDPEQALKLLNDKLDLGMITKEEYQIQRALIINKL